MIIPEKQSTTATATSYRIELVREAILRCTTSRVSMNDDNKSNIEDDPALLAAEASSIWSVAWHPTLPIIATTGQDRAIRIWRRLPSSDYNATTTTSNSQKTTHKKKDESKDEWHPVAIIKDAHKRTIRSCNFSPDGSVLATASFDATTSLWEQHSPEYNSEIDNGLKRDLIAANVIEDSLGFKGNENTHTATTIGNNNDDDDDEDEEHPYGKRAFGWECVATLEGHENEVKCVSWSSDGSLLATCGRDKSVWIWGVEPDGDFQCLSVLQEHEQDVKSVCWHPTEEYLASGSYDDTVRIWQDDNQDDWYCSAVLSGHQSTVWTVSFDKSTPQGHHLLSAGDDRSVRFWHRDVDSERLAHGSGRDTGGRNALPSIIIERQKQKWICDEVLEEVHERAIYCADWGRSGLIVTCGGDNSVRLLGRGTQGKFEVLHTATNPHGMEDVNCVAWSPVDDMVFASAGDDGCVVIWRVVRT